ncbi:HAD family hydrolase [Paenibacillus alvei]|uniref:HAD family hydrolase n=1 Tax=Paenibacillus alvei TaxID=44250 RepID=A0ABT4GY85_PAEAL|nr:HAD family hydrolase [Paenibacillus alvei]MCY9761645.1 HAD family hydrolase [Paenibacillus alvei]MCY9769686.1 HAD family hydrolase [Paenibacillus alvei]
MIKAVIFDFDGLIVDTETAWYESYSKVSKAYGVDLKIDVWGQCVGASFEEFDPLDYIVEHADRQVDREAFKQEADVVFADIMDHTQLRPGVIDYLEEAKRSGLRIALASSSNRNWIESYLNRFNIRSYFEVVNTSDDVERIKPAPDLYEKTIRELGINGFEAVAFEDSFHGMTAAKAAGVYCVVVPNQVTSHMEFAGSDGRLSSMAEKDLHAVINTIAALSQAEAHNHS